MKEKKISRAKFKCPPELAEIIRLANLVPVRITTPDFESEMRLEIDRLKAETGDPAPLFSVYKFTANLIKHLPAKFLAYLDKETFDRAFPSGVAPKSYQDEMRYKQEYVRCYDEYCYTRGSLIRLVLRLEQERQRMREIEKERSLEENSLTFDNYIYMNWEAYPIHIGTTLLRNDAGKLQLTGLAALIGKFDDSRLRKCQICERIFWANRKESEACSPQCANVLRVRRYRSLSDDEKAEKKQKRTANSELVKNGLAKSKKRRNK